MWQKFIDLLYARLIETGALENMIFGYLGIFVVIILIVACITALNVIPAKIAERKAKADADDDDDDDDDDE